MPIATTPLTLPLIADDRDCRVLSLEEVRTLALRKKGVRSRYNYGKCTRCCRPNTQYLFRVMRGDYEYEEILEQLCSCGHIVSWPICGVLEDGEVTQSSFLRPRDSRRQASYDWQSHILRSEACNQHLTEFNVEAEARCIAYDYEIPAPSFQWLDRGQYCTMEGWWNMSMVRGWGQRRWVLVHEMAHALHEWLMQEKRVQREASHGSTWMAIYVILLVERCGEDEASLLASLDQAGLPYLDLTQTREILEANRLERQSKRLAAAAE